MTDRIPLTLVVFRPGRAPYLARDKRGKVRTWKTWTAAERHAARAEEDAGIDNVRVMTIDDARRCYGDNPAPAAPAY